MSAAPAGSAPLKRLGGGRWQTRDERFTIEPQSGTWVVVDAEQTDDLGLPLVRGPFGSLTAAKDAIEAARGAAAVASPLEARVVASRQGQPGDQASGAEPAAPSPSQPAVRPTPSPRHARAVAAPTVERAPAPVESVRQTVEAAEPVEPRWLTDLEPADRRRARGLIKTLVADGARDPQGIVRRDVVGNVATTAAHAVRTAIEGLDRAASPARLARLLAEGRDDRLGVRWRLVDDRGRPIPLDLDALDRWVANPSEAPDEAAPPKGRGR